MQIKLKSCVTLQECSTTNFSNKVYFVSEQQTGTFEAVYGW